MLNNKTLCIFSLNTEYGKYSSTLIPYIESIRDNFDIFCFQEVPNNAQDTTCFEEGYDPKLFQRFEKVLSEFTPYYSEFVENSFGIATFVRKTLRQKYKHEEYLF
jgi:hypothetical protein